MKTPNQQQQKIQQSKTDFKTKRFYSICSIQHRKKVLKTKHAIITQAHTDTQTGPLTALPPPVKCPGTIIIFHTGAFQVHEHQRGKGLYSQWAPAVALSTAAVESGRTKTISASMSMLG